jgi:hypothetical protein
VCGMQRCEEAKCGLGCVRRPWLGATKRGNLQQPRQAPIGAMRVLSASAAYPLPSRRLGHKSNTTAANTDRRPPEGQAQHVVGKPVLGAVVPDAEGGGGGGHHRLQRREAQLGALLLQARGLNGLVCRHDERPTLTCDTGRPASDEQVTWEMELGWPQRKGAMGCSPPAPLLQLRMRPAAQQPPCGRHAPACCHASLALMLRWAAVASDTPLTHPNPQPHPRVTFRTSGMAGILILISRSLQLAGQSGASWGSMQATRASMPSSTK